MGRFPNRQEPAVQRGASAAAATQRGRQRPWAPWAVGVGLLLAGALVGWGALDWALSPFAGASAVKAGAFRPSAADDRAEVAGGQLSLEARPGEQVELTWNVLNTGQADWPVYRYRFVPAEGQNLPVIALPRGLGPGAEIKVKVHVMAPDREGPWAPSWDLTGPRGAVPGGRLTAAVLVSASARSTMTVPPPAPPPRAPDPPAPAPAFPPADPSPAPPPTTPPMTPPTAPPPAPPPTTPPTTPPANPPPAPPPTTPPTTPPTDPPPAPPPTTPPTTPPTDPPPAPPPTTPPTTPPTDPPPAPPTKP